MYSCYSGSQLVFSLCITWLTSCSTIIGWCGTLQTRIWLCITSSWRLRMGISWLHRGRLAIASRCATRWLRRLPINRGICKRFLSLRCSIARPISSVSVLAHRRRLDKWSLGQIPLGTIKLRFFVFELHACEFRVLILLLASRVLVTRLLGLLV